MHMLSRSSRRLGLLLAVSVAAPAAAQGLQWVRSPVNGRLYALTQPMGWQAAEAEAQRAGGHLVTVRSQEEHDWLMQRFGPGHYRWMSR